MAKVKRLHPCGSKRNGRPKDLESSCRTAFRPMNGYSDSGMNTVYTVDTSFTYDMWPSTINKSYFLRSFITVICPVRIPNTRIHTVCVVHPDMSLFNAITWLDKMGREMDLMVPRDLAIRPTVLRECVIL